VSQYSVNIDVGNLGTFYGFLKWQHAFTEIHGHNYTEYPWTCYKYMESNVCNTDWILAFVITFHKCLSGRVGAHFSENPPSEDKLDARLCSPLDLRGLSKEEFVEQSPFRLLLALLLRDLLEEGLLLSKGV